MKLYSRKGSTLPHIVLGRTDDGELIMTPVVMASEKDIKEFRKITKKKVKSLIGTEEYVLAEWYYNERLTRDYVNVVTKDFTADASKIKWAMNKFNMTLKDIKDVLQFVLDDSFWSGVVISLASIATKSKSNEKSKFENILISRTRNKKKSTSCDLDVL